jgi:hypothetical protein
MAPVTLARAPTIPPVQPRLIPGTATSIGLDTRMYAIAFDIDTDTLQRSYPGPS